MVKKKTESQSFEIRGEELLAKVKEIIKEGNARRITIKNKDGKTLLAVPLTIGLVGVAIAPVFAAIGALAALLTECIITVEKK